MGSTAVFREINKIVIVSTVYKNHSVTFLFNKGIILNFKKMKSRNNMTIANQIKIFRASNILIFHHCLL